MQQKKVWVTPKLDSLDIDKTLNGILAAYAETFHTPSTTPGQQVYGAIS